MDRKATLDQSLYIGDSTLVNSFRVIIVQYEHYYI